MSFFIPTISKLEVHVGFSSKLLAEPWFDQIFLLAFRILKVKSLGHVDMSWKIVSLRLVKEKFLLNKFLFTLKQCQLQFGLSIKIKSQWTDVSRISAKLKLKYKTLKAYIFLQLFSFFFEPYHDAVLDHWHDVQVTKRIIFYIFTLPDFGQGK